MDTERPSALLTDLYQFNMIQAYLDHGETKTAVFEFFVRTLPARPADFSLPPVWSRRSIIWKTCASRKPRSSWFQHHRPIWP